MKLLPGTTKQSQRGALMAAALLIMVVGGVFVASWVGLMGARAQQVSLMEDACARRISLMNSRMIARQLLLGNAFKPNSSVPPGTTDVLDTHWGGYDVGSGWSNLNVTATTETAETMSTVYPYNYLSFRPVPAYIAIQETLRPYSLDGLVDDFKSYSFVRGGSPMLAGDLISVYRKPPQATTELDIYNITSTQNVAWTVYGRVILHHLDSLFAASTPNPLKLPFRCSALQVQDVNTSRAVYGVGPNGANMPVSDMPVVKSSRGKSTVLLPAGPEEDYFGGYLDVVQNDDNPDNSLWHFMNREAAAGRTTYTTITDTAEMGSASSAVQVIRHVSGVNDPTWPPDGYPKGYPDPYPVLYVRLGSPDLTHLRIMASFQHVVFEGQSNAIDYAGAATLPPVIIEVLPGAGGGPNVPRFHFINENNRRWVLGVKDGNAATLDLYWDGNSAVAGSSAAYDWRLMMVSEYRTLMFNLPVLTSRVVRITGGLMTNWTVKRRTVSGEANVARLSFLPELDPQPAGAVGAPFASLLPRDVWVDSYFLPEPQ